MAHQGTTFANDLSTDRIYWYSTDSSRYQIQTGASGQIAFGVVTDLGDKVSGSDNWSVRYNSVWDRYEITITNELYHLDDYTTTVTAIGGPIIASTGSANGQLLIYLNDLQGDTAKNSFSFVVNKHQYVNSTPNCLGEIPTQLQAQQSNPTKTLRTK